MTNPSAANLNFPPDFDDSDDDFLFTSVESCKDGFSFKFVDCHSINMVESTDEKKLDVSNKSDHAGVVPLHEFRPGYLWVSDLSQQSWCEQQLYYKFTVPGIVEESPAVEAMAKGTDLHLARELAAHDVVQVSVTSNEDIWAIKTLNLLSAINAFQQGQSLAREVPIFGVPFENEDIFVVGLIDELRFDAENYTIDLQELKTRTSRNNPSKAVSKQHKIQVMLYKKLFDNLVKGLLTKETVAKHLKLDLGKSFGESVQKHLEEKSLPNKGTLNGLLDHVFEKMQSLTCINQLHIEYVYQDTAETLNHVTHEYDENQTKILFLDFVQFWKGQRSPIGVDLEDAWKCQRCDYQEICEWRKKKSEECSKKNIARNKLK